MHIFKHPDFDGHDALFFTLKKSGMRGVIAIHRPFFHPILKRPSTLGGMRMQPYESTKKAYTDDLRLSRGMSYKAALAGVYFGGAKSVIIGDPKKQKTEEMLDEFADVLNNLGGLYIVAEDMGMSESDMDYLSQKTRWVSGKSKKIGGSGNPGPTTARGVFEGLKACLEHRFNSPKFDNHRFAIQGLGNVGFPLALLIAKNGGNLIITDTDNIKISQAIEHIRQYGISYKVVSPDAIHNEFVTAYCPCALGAVINGQTARELKCEIVAGAANNQLERPEHGDILRQRSILYAPDYVINAGGLISVADEFNEGGYNETRVFEKVNEIYDRLKLIFNQSRRENTPTHRIADTMAQEIIAKKIEECGAQTRQT